MGRAPECTVGEQDMMQDITEYYRYCPDQPKILISDAVCFSRRLVNHPWCAGCQFNDDEKKQREAANGGEAGAESPPPADQPSEDHLET